MSTNKPNPTDKIEQEFTKQIDQIDKRLDRGGMIYFIPILILLFIGAFWLIDTFSLRGNEKTILEDQTQLVQTIEDLENRVSQLEEKIVELEKE